MAFWDFFSDKPKVELPPGKKTSYQGDMKKTALLYKLFEIPREKRDESWMKNFATNVADAGFRCSEPQVIQGPDGFPYFILFLPNQYQPFQAFVIRRMKDDFLLQAGYGIVINPHGSQSYADWVFSYGDVVNFHINGEFYTSLHIPEFEDDELNYGDVVAEDPPEKFLPKQSRFVIKEFLKSQGIQQAKILLLTKNIDGCRVQRIAFNIYPENFPSTKHFDFTMNHLHWFLPRHYKILRLPAGNKWSTYFNEL
jgi:hypothetical protein